MELLMDIGFSTRDEFLLVRLAGKLDRETAPQLETALRERIAAGEIRCILDMGDLTYISSAGLRVLLVAGKLCKSAGGGIAFCRLQGMVGDVFSLAYMNTLFPTAATVEQAAEAFRKG